MKPYQSRIVIWSALSVGIITAGLAQKPPSRKGGPPADQPAGTGIATTVAGTISQFNYNRDAEIEGLLLSNNILVHLPRRVASYIEASLHTGDSVQVTGYAQTTLAGLQTMETQTIQDKSSGKSVTVPQPGAAAPFSGSGRIRQLNYGPDALVNGFVFDNDTLATVPPFSAANPSSVRVGATVGYTGYARKSISGRTVVDVKTLTINGQTMVLCMTGPGRGPGSMPPPPPPGVPFTAPGAQPRPAGPLVAQPTTPLPPDRTTQPPPPPSPAQPPRS